ncbi:oligopeptide/dipeptide ABC transporter, ATP-binding protein, C-terminal domain-containing protein [Sinosporangium album]|uniref:Oligopeptide/dipeptide ABC transporter, ATP-binding protein, C-terminal domain-containing protein n=1 Tax=Sinosporangium album TaxID=504805 RepID=A0A1G7X587_9ACTN|nr:dipeptide/oligopeptide/nickel ABC transporter permease/ATP-binding protein [Sinosporangium album]SDG79364.1 oligopeptide/dipeptide ABC transporter, ATP-binding protein, C-terminal domain-containing protein [Sinosporangium album]
MRHLLRTPSGVIGLALVAVTLVIAAVGPAIWGQEAETVNAAAALQGSSAEHPLGTDHLGRDILARVLAGGQFTVALAFLATAIGAGLGTLLGVLPAVLPRRAGRLVTGAVNALVAFPALLLAMFTAVISGLGAKGAVLGIGIAFAPSIARLTQTLSASVASADYVAAARLLRVPRWRIATRHVLPNIGEPIILNLTAALGSSLVAMSGMSFLGLGVQPPSYDWGRLLFDGFSRIYVDPMVAIGPAIAIVAAGIGFNLLGEALARSVARAPVGGKQAVGKGAAMPSSGEEPVEGAVLSVKDLTVTFPDGVTPVRGLSLTIMPGEIVGLVGESGSGKSMTANAVGGLVAYPGVVTAGHMSLCGEELSTLSEAKRRKLLGTSMAMVFQDPMASLNPALKVGGQLAEVSLVHQGAKRPAAWARAIDRLRQVHIPDPEKRARQHPHEFSGGMRQRAVIAMGLMGTPRLLIADEPTTALDVTVQRQILKLLREVSAEAGAGALFISHDIAVVSELCDRVVVMYAGRVVEELPVADLVDGASHPYTKALLASLPDMETDRDKPLASIPGHQPSPADVGEGCAFASRCALATDRCVERPPLTRYDAAHAVACWHAETRKAEVAIG